MLFISVPSFAIYQVWTCTTGEIIINGEVIGSTEYCYYEYFNDDDPWGTLPLGPQDWGGGGSNGSTAKERYCEAVDILNTFLSALPITGDASAGYSIAELSAGNFRNILLAAYTDITTFIGNGFHPDHYGNGVIQWNTVNINWNNYNNWQGAGVPSQHNGGAQHIFASFVNSKAGGSGKAILTDPDPDPGTACP